jgi:4-hydroxy-tetrahydrodipicolinate reductase
VKYCSPVDEISITHAAFSREGFAVGAVCAAEWLPGHSGIFTLQDVIKQQ